MQADVTTYWILVAYLTGCMISVIVIEFINTIEVENGGTKLIPESKAVLSWLWLAFVAAMFIKTLLHRK
jgi:hypothetical protein